MGGGNSRRRTPNTPIPAYPGAGGASPGISRPVAVTGTGIGGATGINPNQQRELMQANQTIANLTNQLNAVQRSGAMGIPQTPYGNYSFPGGTPPPMAYATPPPMSYGPPPYGSPPYGPPSPMPPNFGAPSPYLYQQQQQQQQQPMMGGMGGMGGAGGYRDTDFAAVANIAGLNPADIALLHREFMNLTRGGMGKIDRTVFRQLLRDVLMEANNEHVDRAIENMFITIDRNHDGFIDFPEFVGAFKDVLKGHATDPHSYFQEHVYPDVLGEQLRASGVGTGIAPQSIAYIQQPAPVATQLVTTGGLNIVPLASTAVQQVPIVCNTASPLQISDASAPLITLDHSQSSYVIATPGQYLITQPTALQCVPLPMM